MSESAADPLADKAAVIRHAVIRLAHRLRVERPQDGISPTKLAVLALLHRNGATTPGEIATMQRQQPQSLTRLFAELEADGMIEKCRGHQDRRQVLLEILPRGRAALGRNMAGRDAWLAQALSVLSETEQEVVRLAAPLMVRLAGFEPSQGEPE